MMVEKRMSHSGKALQGPGYLVGRTDVEPQITSVEQSLAERRARLAQAVQNGVVGGLQSDQRNPLADAVYGLHDGASQGAEKVAPQATSAEQVAKVYGFDKDDDPYHTDDEYSTRRPGFGPGW